MRVHAYIFHLLTHAEGTCRRKWVDCILICRRLTSLYKKNMCGPQSGVSNQKFNDFVSFVDFHLEEHA